MKAWKEWRIFRTTHWMEWIHHLYVLLALSGYIFAAFTSNTIKETILLSVLAAYLFLVLIFLAYFVHTLGTKAKYAEITYYYHEANHILRDLYRYMDSLLNDSSSLSNEAEEKIQSYLEMFLTSASTAFSLTSGVSCRMSIKVLAHTKDGSHTSNSDFGELFAKTLARDHLSKHAHCEYKSDDEKKHLLSKNTDYLLITAQDQNFYFNGNIDESHPHYQSTYTQDGAFHGNRPKASLKAYENRSTIVWPIRYKYLKDEKINVDSQEEKWYQNHCLYGFLTLDADARNAFSLRYDEKFGAAFADSLYHILDQYRKLKKYGD